MTSIIHQIGKRGIIERAANAASSVGQDDRIWDRCEQVQHCGNLLPASPSHGTTLPRHLYYLPGIRR